ncbi:SDR family NAD(P)-dependent oxidoreductase [Streptomyces sp. KM273126]|uniref:SDR family NAD(P)-dependent oxidoreductase n=1 Tax=Streptomyces sp. KM273126 TaxID=2545247 RepID=UPI002867EDD3|nr:SDR family NAD(P)-dependent oxidoreductase [Streptomyces sp. KM273126]
MGAQNEPNLFGPMNITRAVLPVMRAQRSEHVITVSSLAGAVGVAFCVAHSAAKFGVEGFMESLDHDVEPFGIHTTIIEPGFFRTELLEDASTTYAELSIDDYAAAAAAVRRRRRLPRSRRGQGQATPRTG